MAAVPLLSMPPGSHPAVGCQGAYQRDQCIPERPIAVRSALGATAFRFAASAAFAARGDALGSGAIAVSGRIGSRTRTFAGIAARHRRLAAPPPDGDSALRSLRRFRSTSRHRAARSAHNRVGRSVAAGLDAREPRYSIQCGHHSFTQGATPLLNSRMAWPAGRCRAIQRRQC